MLPPLIVGVALRCRQIGHLRIDIEQVFEYHHRMATQTATPGVVAVRAWLDELSSVDVTSGGDATDRERIELIGELERRKGAAAAAQARLTVDFDDSQRQAQREAGVRAQDVGAGVAAQIGLARRDSPVKGARHLGLARVLVEELPRTFRALSVGVTTEWRATLVARETACLTREDRRRVDAELSGRPGGLGSLGDRQTEAEARRLAYRLDPEAAVRRHSPAESERRVTLRPAPDTMTLLTGLLPVRQGGGTVPAGVARSWVRETAAEVWLRRLYAAPGTGSLVAMDSARRVFTVRLRRPTTLRGCARPATSPRRLPAGPPTSRAGPCGPPPPPGTATSAHHPPGPRLLRRSEPGSTSPSIGSS